ncbi:NADH dehydrogenase (ubiquinone) complex I, assembly factor 6 [Seminavis robusta]|uniref:NADH dehydrogenase (Ubiquinone) complex I, assembly factor 6 n=1 Tax=Seminavis robusta TaxID=568900 RepID=A0A9N8DLP2_9STRA|nr:NADH dehydrogenase (ubiquinone) complex I, assembly factor 6 [Seminavis robusta]|eukprot:Sro225_g091830.1 NADH dehydrogenase (ubiquinone) complex I, assembly factor 6 (1642) ;mRNA; r:47880-52888
MNTTTAMVEDSAPPAAAAVTAVEATATPEVQATAEATATATLPLLRNWLASTEATATATAEPATAEPATPPMAPIQLLDDRVQRSSRTYPVARGILDVVGAVAEHIHDHIYDHMYHVRPEPDSGLHQQAPQAPIECLSIRSEGGILSSSVAPASAPAPPRTTATSLPVPNAPPESVRSVPPMDRGSIEELNEDQFVLIDGDLIVIPPVCPPNEQEREGLEEYQRDRDYITRPSCQPKPMRKGVRGFKKWLKKRIPRKEKSDKHNHSSRKSKQSHEESIATANSPNVSLCEFTTEPGDSLPNSSLQATNATGNPTVHKRSPRNKSPMRAWKIKRDKHKDTTGTNTTTAAHDKREGGEFKKKRRSWRRPDSRGTKTTPPATPPHQQQKASSNDVASLVASAPPATDAATASYPPASAEPLSASVPIPPNSGHAAAAAVMPEPPHYSERQHDPYHHNLTLEQQQLQPPSHAAFAASYDSLPSQNAYASYDSLDQAHHQQQQHEAYAYDALAAPTPPLPPMSGPSTQHISSVQASFVGNADQVFEADVIGATCAEAYIESAYYAGDDKKDEPSYSLLSPDADYKVDKADAPDVEYMLRRAAQESANDVLEPDEAMDNNGLDPLAMPSSVPFTSPGKSSGMSCPLSTAKVTDETVHNDVLKVVMVGAPNADKSTLARAIRQSNKKPKRRTTLGVDVHSWTPDMSGQEQVKFSIWDVQGASREDGSANFGANPGIQSLFFSANALYLLVWDLASDNMKTYGQNIWAKLEQDEDDDEDEDDDDDEEDNEFLFEEAKRQADLALQADIEKRVLSWVECIRKRGSGSSILPVAVIPEHMSTSEAKRRCDMMQNLLELHIDKYQNDPTMPKLLIGMDNVMCVSLANNGGIHELQETLIAIAADEAVFDHVGTPVPGSVARVLDTVRRLKQDHKLVRVDHLMSELGKHIPSYEEITHALHFLSSIGELLYFGNDHDELLSRYIILSRKWFVSALSCILRNDLKRELSETRRFMNMQCIYSNQQFPESSVIQSLTDGNASSCPLLSSTDTNMLWLSMQFMREAADRSSQLSENSTTSSTMFGFLERLLVQSGVFLPLNVSNGLGDPEVYFVPSLLATTTDNNDVWTFKSSESWMTTLCHSWLFRDGAPCDLMEHITVALVRDIHAFSNTFATLEKTPPHRTQTFPLVRSGANDFLQAHDSEAIGRIRIHQIMCWQSSFLVKIGSIFADSDNGELKESFTEVFVTLVDQSSSHCVASDAMRATMQRLVVSGRGQAGSHGAKLWRGGLEVVIGSIQKTLGDFSNIDRQVVCPECLAHSQPRNASTWSWDSVKAAAESGSSIVRCIRGHRVDSNLICGTVKRQDPSKMEDPSKMAIKPVPELLPSVVLVGLWDVASKEIRNVGSGFVVDKRLGLILTAGHVLFDMTEGKNFGAPYFGLKNARVVIGVIPEGGQKHNAVYRYFAEIIADDISSVDACVVRLTSKLHGDINGDMSQQPGEAFGESPLNLEAIHQESLKTLKLTTRFELEESVRILGFNQGGEGVLEQGKHVNRSADFARGYIVKKFVAPPMSEDDSSHSSEQSTKSMCFVPREEVVVICPTIAGHSGGPCVNNDGRVVGILSRADPGERQRCYLVPASEMKDLVKKAKKHFTRPSMML